MIRHLVLAAPLALAAWLANKKFDFFSITRYGLIL